MQRRQLLQGAAALPLLTLPAAALDAGPITPGAAPDPRVRLPRVRPGDAGWPSASSWQKLKDAVGGNLLEVQPLFEPCRLQSNGAACRDVLANLRNPFYISDQPAGTEVSGWLDAWTPGASVYALKARNTADVVAGVNFAREKRLRLVVKGTGHSYQGTSNAADSLLIWTHGMNRVTLHEAFVGSGCEGKAVAVPAVTAEAGAMWIDLYQAVTNNKGLAGSTPEALAAARDTATNPAVTEAFALAIIADGEGAAYPGMARGAVDLEAARRDAHAIDRAIAELRRVAPQPGSYVSESNYFNSQWQQAFWGGNYPRLRSIKDRYDPEGLFFVHHGVGSEDWSADGFTRLS